jgi:hypothetical protein
VSFIPIYDPQPSFLLWGIFRVFLVRLQLYNVLFFPPRIILTYRIDKTHAQSVYIVYTLCSLELKPLSQVVICRTFFHHHHFGLHHNLESLLYVAHEQKVFNFPEVLLADTPRRWIISGFVLVQARVTLKALCGMAVTRSNPLGYKL